MKAARTHRVTLTVTFDKPLSRRQAVAEVKDNIHGQFYTSAPGIDWQDWRVSSTRYPDAFTVRSVRSAKA